MDSDLNGLKSHPKVLELYGSRVHLKKETSTRYRASCPLGGHQDKNPSFDVYLQDGVWMYGCFACGGKGNIFQFLQALDKIEFREAVKIVREFCSEWSEARKQVSSTFKSLSEEKPVEKKTYSEAEYKKLEEALKNSKAGQEFLAGRGINFETARKLRLGYRSDVGRLAGDANADISAHGWIVFPTFSNGVITSLKYRSIVRKAFCKQPGMATEMFNTSTIDCLEPVFLVEGELDAAVLEQTGFRAISLPNATTVKPEWKDKLLEAEYVVLAGDNDAAGNKVMEKLWREMKERTYLLRWPDGCKDANDFWNKCGRDQSRFKQAVDALVAVARSKPMEGVYDVRQSLLSANHTNASDSPDRLRFPWKEVDQMALITPGDVVTFYSTDSGMGKTSMVLQASLFNATKHARTILNYQAEMTPQQIDTIIASHLLRRDRLTLSEEDYRAAGKSLDSSVKYYIGRNTSLTNIGQVLDLMEAAIRRFGAEVVILDNLHFLCRNENDPIKAQSNAMQRIKNLSGQYNVIWVNVHQARKADQNHKRKVTHVSDLDGSKAVQNDSSVIFSIHRDEIKHSKDDEVTGTNEYDPITEIRLQKVREKGPGKSFAKLLFLGGISTFASVENSEPELFG